MHDGKCVSLCATIDAFELNTLFVVANRPASYSAEEAIANHDMLLTLS